MNANVGARLLAAAAGPVLLAGCAAHAATPSKPPPGSGAMTPGMIMPGGSTMGAAAPAQVSRPSSAARMICAGETRADIATVLQLPRPPAGHAGWAAPSYTCTYHLPRGDLVLSVTESTSDVAAAHLVRAERNRLHAHTRLAGLTASAFGNQDGLVVLRKDADTLRVDATGLPRVFGPDGERRVDFAYEIASDILGCWTGG